MTNIYSIKKGEKYPIVIKFKNKDLDTPIDLTNAIIKFQIKDELKDEFCIIQKTITTDTDVLTEGRIVDPINGEVTIKFTDEDFEKLIVERIYYLTIWWEVPDEDFAKVVSSNDKDYLKFIVRVP